MMSFRYFLMVIVVCFSMNLHAQDETTLIPDQPQTVTISADAPALLIYEAQAGNVITITTQTAEDDESRPDTVLWVIAPDDTQLAYNDNALSADGEFLSDARLENLRLPTAGDYRIVVDSFNGVSEGEVEVSLTLFDPFAMQVEAFDSTEQISFTLPAGEIFRYGFEAAAGESITFTAQDTGRLLDPYLRLLDASGAVLASNDDHASADFSLDVFDAQLVGWIAPEDGTYTVQITDVLGRGGEMILAVVRE